MPDAPKRRGRPPVAPVVRPSTKPRHERGFWHLCHFVKLLAGALLSDVTSKSLKPAPFFLCRIFIRCTCLNCREEQGSSKKRLLFFCRNLII